MKILACISYLLATVLLSWAFCFGEWSTMLVVGVAIAMMAIPTVILALDRVEDDARSKLMGSVAASNAAFMRELRTMDHDHALRLQEIAEQKGMVMARAEVAEAKIARMTTRPKINGRIVKQSVADALAAPGKHEIVDAQALPMDSEKARDVTSGV